MMDFLVELIGELITLPFDLAMESSRVKTWVKTVLKSLCALFLIAMFVLLTVLVAMEGVLWRTLLLSVFSAGISLYLIYSVIRGHRRGWKE